VPVFVLRGATPQKTGHGGFKGISIQGFNPAALGMGQAAMTSPAVAVRHGDPGDGFRMTPFTIGLEDFGTVIGNPNNFRDPSRIKGKNILHAGEALPGHMVDEIIIGQVAVDALEAAVGTLMSPGLIFGFHDVAPGAEFRRSGFSVQLGRAKGGKQAPGYSDYDHYPQIRPKPFTGGKEHGSPLFSFNF
jgi:hypothetical protein